MRRYSTTSNPGWLTALKEIVNKRPVVLFRFREEEWENLRSSKHGTNVFTFTHMRDYVNEIQAPRACILIGWGEYGRSAELHFAVLKSRTPVTTLQSRLKITNAQPIAPSSEKELLGLITDNSLRSILRSRLEAEDPVVRLSPTLSVHLIEKLAEQQSNRQTLRAVVTVLETPKTYSSNIALQQDAVTLSLKTFGLPDDAVPDVLELPSERDTALAGFNIIEDNVIEHDARIVPGFTLTHADLTGRALFRNNNGTETLEIITANKRPLEEAFGVDLIYLNSVKQNIVMVQYKMLERSRRSDKTDWLYRPDGQLEKEINRMNSLSRISQPPGSLEYRLNPKVCYLRFVRRDAALGKSAVTIPIDHYETLRNDPAFKGPRKALHISYNTLNGRYLRQEGFLELIRSGYIGAYAQTTHDLTVLINEILKGGRAVIGVVQRFTTS